MSVRVGYFAAVPEDFDRGISGSVRLVIDRKGSRNGDVHQFFLAAVGGLSEGSRYGETRSASVVVVVAVVDVRV